MSYQPKYCCQCGEKIEDVNRNIFSSPRFCALCVTDFGSSDLIRRVLTGIGSVLMVLFIGYYFQKPEKSLNVASNQLKSDVQTVKSVSNERNETTQVQVGKTVQVPARQLNGASPVNQAVTAKSMDSNQKPPVKSPVEVSEATSLCGAPTKKGTPCSRRVKGGGRCWQHEEQTTSASSDKRNISR